MNSTDWARDTAIITALQARVERLEFENTKLRAVLDAAKRYRKHHHLSDLHTLWATLDAYHAKQEDNNE